jgi:two-component system, NtrC family, response regulator AtoC
MPGGTLFLDEIADLDLSLQAKLLQLLQDGRFTPLGCRSEKCIEARIVCATNRPLQQAASSGAFRPDLFYRINGLSVELPALRQRSGDIPMLVAYMLDKYARKYDREVQPFSNSLLKRLETNRWTGNIRQLQNVMHQYVIFESEEIITAALQEAYPDYSRCEIPSDATLGLKSTIRQAMKPLERRIILAALEANGWHRGLAARQLRISYGALLYKMRETGLVFGKRGSVLIAESPDLSRGHVLNERNGSEKRSRVL